MNFVIPGLLFILLVCFFVLVWKAAKDWRWYQIVAVCFTMLLAVALIFPTAGVLGSRSAWHKKKEELEKQAAEIRVTQRELKYGDPSDVNSEGIVQLTQRLSELNVEVGRRWRDLLTGNIAGNVITLSKQQLAPADGIPAAADDDAPADPPEALVPANIVVYGFGESMDPTLQMAIPTSYLGEFRVTASTPTQVTLSPLGQVDPALLQQARSWSLYELLPLDGHLPFIAPGSVPSDDEYFGSVDKDLIGRLLGNNVSEATKDKYRRDGSQSTQDDPPLSRWRKIEFTKNHSIEVDSPNNSTLEDKVFDGNGRALDSRLQLGGTGKLNFKTGDQILVKEEAADQLAGEEGVAKKLSPYYLRPLNDYRFVLRRIRLRLEELESRKVELAFEKKVLDEAIDKTVKMLAVNQEAKLKLEQDYAQVQLEKQSIEKYAQGIADKVKSTRDEMIRLHRKNLELERQLQERHLKIQRQLDALTLAR